MMLTAHDTSCLANRAGVGASARAGATLGFSHRRAATAFCDFSPADRHFPNGSPTFLVV
jgi:hypothetical protein